MFILRPSNPEGSPRRTLSANTPSERTREGQHATCFKEHFEGLHVLDVLCTLTRLCQLENYAGRSTVTPMLQIRKPRHLHEVTAVWTWDLKTDETDLPPAPQAETMELGILLPPRPASASRVPAGCYFSLIMLWAPQRQGLCRDSPPQGLVQSSALGFHRD